MTLFDDIAGGLLVISALIGYARGATREVTTVVALILAAIGAMVALRFTGPIAQHAIHTVWLAKAAAVLIVFIAAYLALRLIGGALTRGVRATPVLSSLDRLLGAGVGLARGALILGAFCLLMGAATPPERMPAWITRAKLYPLARAAGAGLRAFAPHGLKIPHGLDPTARPDGGQTRDNDYSNDGRDAPDDAAETSR